MPRKNSEVTEVLKKAKYLLREERRWIKQIDHDKINGVNCYCARGAVIHAVDLMHNKNRLSLPKFRAINRVLNLLELGIKDKVGYYRTVTSFNDNAASYNDIIKLFDNAIELSKKNKILPTDL